MTAPLVTKVCTSSILAEMKNVPPRDPTGRERAPVVSPIPFEPRSTETTWRGILDDRDALAGMNDGGLGREGAGRLGGGRGRGLGRLAGGEQGAAHATTVSALTDRGAHISAP